MLLGSSILVSMKAFLSSESCARIQAPLWEIAAAGTCPLGTPMDDIAPNASPADGAHSSSTKNIKEQEFSL